MEKVWWLFFALFNLCVMFWDFRWRRVPNALLVTVLAVQLVLLAARSTIPLAGTPGPHGWTGALAGFVLGFAFLPLWLWRRVVGAGDVKYLAVLGAVIGIGPLAGAILIGSILGMPHALWLVWCAIFQAREGAPRRSIPYAAYVALAALSVALMQWNSHWCSAYFSWFCMES